MVIPSLGLGISNFESVTQIVHVMSHRLNFGRHASEMRDNIDSIGIKKRLWTGHTIYMIKMQFIF
jgi:hypothetical protein